MPRPIKRRIPRRRYIYPYAPDGQLQGYQVRFKRQINEKTETTSVYFSVANCGSVTKALQQAAKFRDKNRRWMRDRRYRVKPPAFLAAF